METVVVNGKVYYAQQIADNTYKEMWDWFVECNLLTKLVEAQALYDNMKEEGLTFGSVEAEGYLRAIKTLCNDAELIIKDVKCGEK